MGLPHLFPATQVIMSQLGSALLLLHGTAAALSPADVLRATRMPGLGYVAPTVHSMGGLLNRHLRRLSPAAFEECAAFDVATLQSRRRRLFGLADPELIAIYPPHDRRSPRIANASELERATVPTQQASRRLRQAASRASTTRRFAMRRHLSASYGTGS
mmetsp:Transcript_26939/g.79316  ORF Transcript_26939/g.79316 Transcript_26939/m.79316 type:complete len:159 (+) Transcript_26939:1379-1855(+)